MKLRKKNFFDYGNILSFTFVHNNSKLRLQHIISMQNKLRFTQDEFWQPLYILGTGFYPV